MTVTIPGYKILGTLGKGGMATVFLAEHEIFRRKVALKVMAQGLAEDPSFGERFLREARIVSQLIHPNIVTVYDVGVHEGCYYLAMEFIDGKDLKHARKHLSLQQKVHIILDIAKALEYAGNKGYVHRDIKPENIMLYTDDSRAVLTDFGIARATEAEISVTQTGTAIGTPHYMSPEQAKGQPVDIRSDIYGLGVVFYLLLVGCVPYDAESAVAIGIKHITDPIPELPEGLEALQPIIDKMMAKLPADRYQRPAELVAQLSRLDINSLVAAADRAVAQAEKSLEGASDDAPTVISRPASRPAPRAPADRPRRPAAQPLDDDPTPVVVNDHDYELEEQDSSVWPWVAGVCVLLLVVTGVFYSQYPATVDSWVADQRGRLQALFAGAGEDSADESTALTAPNASAPVVDTASSVNGADPSLQRLTAPTEESGSPGVAADQSVNPRVSELQEQIAELAGQLPDDPSRLTPLVTAWLELKAVAPGSVDADAAIDALLAEEIDRVARSARDGELDEAQQRLEQLARVPQELLPDDLGAVTELVAEQRQIQQWLQEGEAFLAADALTRPADNNAHSRFEQVLAVAPDNVQAKEGLAKIATRLAALAAAALENNQQDQAEALVARALDIDPDNANAAALSQRMTERSRQARQAEIEDLLAKATGQLREAAFFEPPENNAYFYFNKVLTLQPNSTAAREGISRTLRGFEARLMNLITQDHFEAVRELVRNAQTHLNDDRMAALELRIEEAIAEKILATHPRIMDIVITGSLPMEEVVGEQPAIIAAGRTLSVSFAYQNFDPSSASVIQAALMDGSRTVNFAQVPVVVTGPEGTQTFRIDRPVEGFPAGRYTIDLLFKGNVLATRDFQVQ